MMTRERELLQQALDALEALQMEAESRRCGLRIADEAIDAIRAYLAAQPEPTPIAWANINKHGDITRTSNKRDAWAKTPLYAAQPAPVPARCSYCDDTGDVNTPTGEWRGRCVCKAGRDAARAALKGEHDPEVQSTN